MSGKGDGIRFDQGPEGTVEKQTYQAFSDELQLVRERQTLPDARVEQNLLGDIAQMEQSGNAKYNSLPQADQNTYHEWVNHFLKQAEGNPELQAMLTNFVQNVTHKTA